MRKYKEDDLQMAVAKYLDFLSVCWCHVANERKTSKIAGLRLKKKGVKSGVPDVLIFEPNDDYSGLAIELKIKPNKPTDNQKEWLESLKEKGWYTEVCYSLDDVRSLIKKYFKKL